MAFSPMSGRAGTVGGMAGGRGVTPAVQQEHRSGAGPAFQVKEGPSVSSSSQWPLRSYLELGALPTAVPCARLHARLILQEWGLDELTESVELIVSELATNALKASWSLSASQPIVLHLAADHQRLTIQVWDAVAAGPVPRSHALDAETGRGLEIVSLLCDRWGFYRPDGGGKIVWAAIEIRSSSEPGR
jgi:anti-sigma regulatory factor (Ser/Thr protein kinase)